MTKCVTVLYPNTDGVRFDFDYYVKHHLPMIQRAHGPAVSSIVLRRGTETPDGGKPPYVATLTITIRDQAAFDRNEEVHRDGMIADVPNFSNVFPVIQIDEIVANEAS